MFKDTIAYWWNIVTAAGLDLAASIAALVAGAFFLVRFAQAPAKLHSRQVEQIKQQQSEIDTLKSPIKPLVRVGIQERSGADRRDAPFAVVSALSVNTTIQPFTLRVEFTAPVVAFDTYFSQDPGTTLEGYREEQLVAPTVLEIMYSKPAFRPEFPLIVKACAASEIRISKVELVGR